MKERFQESQHEAKKVGTAMDAEKERQQQKLAQQLAKKKAANRSLEDEVKVSRMREESHIANQALRDVNIALDKVRDELEEEKRAHEATKIKLAKLQAQLGGGGGDDDELAAVKLERDELLDQVKKLKAQLRGR